jgi:hypothetical protein
VIGEDPECRGQEGCDRAGTGCSQDGFTSSHAKEEARGSVALSPAINQIYGELYFYF